ncbi:carotenoid oxygenase family protein [Rhodoligotrophos defluvii]|uniref:carotenoid oxygenase family protein n=1 Tax=Rhodoligotrophos defluvii TaxID=2561934 RepID=UPI0010C95792|nr:carotenoid oxygenase family protein [Rhodoligotrophos defluvii]
MPETNSAWSLGFTTLEREVDRLPLEVAGALPPWLTGSLLRTGPAKFEVGSDAYAHWFDGLAMLHAFDFSGGAVHYTNRFLHSKSYREAARKGRISRGEFMTDPCRTIFGRVMAIFDRKPTDNANVNVMQLANQIVAMTETPMPICFDPLTLETRGRLDFSPSIKGQISTAHPHNDGERSYSYIIEIGRRSVYRVFADESGTQRILAELPVDQPSYMHSFGMSERYLVLTEFPLRVNPLRLAFSGKPFITNYRWRPSLGTQFTVIDKASGAVVARARAAPCFSFHHVNAYEANGALLIDLLAYPDAQIIEDLRLDRLRSGAAVNATSTLTRFRIPLRSTRAEAVEIEHEPLCDTRIELPRIDYSRRAGKPHRCVWGVAQSATERFLDTITKIELSAAEPATVKRWARPGAFPGEAVFVARPFGMEEDDGVLLSVVLDVDARTSFLLVLNAATLDELARAWVPHHIPFGFHGSYFSNLPN